MEINSDMRQEEFLKTFQEALTGKVSDRIIQENVNYYRNYMNQEIQRGKSEDEVLTSLGDPRLLAKTIEESNKFANGDESYTANQSGWNFQGSRSGQGAQEQGSVNGNKSIQISGWVVALIAIVVLVVVVKLAFSVISFLSPVILGLAIGFLIYRLITGGGQRKH